MIQISDELWRTGLKKIDFSAQNTVHSNGQFLTWDSFKSVPSKHIFIK